MSTNAEERSRPALTIVLPIFNEELNVGRLFDRIDDNVLDGYRTAYAAWQDRLRQQITNQLGRYLPVRSDTSLDRLLLHDWRRLGLIN